MVIATGLIPLSLLSIVSTIVMWESSQWLGKILYWLKELQESKDGCTDHSDITEILLKTAFNTIHSINQSTNHSLTFFYHFFFLHFKQHNKIIKCES